MQFDSLFPDLTASLARETYAYLCSMLPPHLADTPEEQAERDKAAMAAVAALHPGDAFEARLAARIVAMDAHAADSLRLAGLAAADVMEVRRYRAQAVSMARQSDSALRALQRMQAVRDKQLAAQHPAAMERAGYWFRDCSVPEPEPAEASPPADASCADEELVRTQAQLDADVALYEVLYPDRAALIRASGGLPARLTFGPPDPKIVAALLRKPAAQSTPGSVAPEATSSR
jgi:hypothetical protein